MKYVVSLMLCVAFSLPVFSGELTVDYLDHKECDAFWPGGIPRYYTGCLVPYDDGEYVSAIKKSCTSPECGWTAYTWLPATPVSKYMIGFDYRIVHGDVDGEYSTALCFTPLPKERGKYPVLIEPCN